MFKILVDKESGAGCKMLESWCRCGELICFWIWAQRITNMLLGIFRTCKVAHPIKIVLLTSVSPTLLVSDETWRPSKGVRVLDRRLKYSLPGSTISHVPFSAGRAHVQSHRAETMVWCDLPFKMRYMYRLSNSYRPLDAGAELHRSWKKMSFKRSGLGSIDISVSISNVEYIMAKRSSWRFKTGVNGEMPLEYCEFVVFKYITG